MKFAEYIPPDLLDPKKLEEALRYIASLPVDIMTKKYILIEWCELTGVKLEKWMVEYITGYQSEKTRG